MRNEIIFKNGRRVWTDADITPKVLTELQTQFESEITEVNRKPLSKHSVLKAKAGIKTPGKIITYSDGFKWEVVPNTFAKSNWNKQEIFGLNVSEETEALIESKNDLNAYNVFAVEYKAKAGTKTPSKPKNTNPNAISWETFEEKYKPQINHILKQKYPKDDPTELTGWGGIMYETYDDEYEYIREMAQKHPNRVWTLVDGDDGELVIIAGWHYVNRMNYVITEKPWNTGDEYVDDEMAKHGAKINYIKKWAVSYIDMYKKSKKIVVELGRMSNKDDVNNALKRRGDVLEVLSISELYKQGSMVPDNHDWVELENLYTNFESEQQLWEIWSLKQRYHFLKDHFRVELSKAKDQTELQKFEWQMEDTARLDYDNLPTLVKMELKNHKFSGQYKTGGPVKLNVTIELITDEYEPEHLQYGVFDYKGELIEPGFEDINQATTWANEQGYNTDKKAKRGAMIDESQTDLFDKSGVKYRAEVGGIGENRWSGNAMEYDTEDEAKDWLRGLASRWYGYNISRVVPVSVPTNQDIDLSDPLMFQNYRKNAKGTKFRTNSVAVKELIKDLENTPYGVGLALLRERLLTHADYDLKKHKKNPKTFENPIFSVGMYEDLFKRIHKELNFDVSKNNVKAVKDLIKDLASTPHEVGLGLLRERMVAYAENDLEVLKDNPKVFDNPIYNSGMYKDLFNRMIKFCDFGNLTSRVAGQGIKTPMIDIGSDNIAKRGAKTGVGSDNTRYPRKADDTGKGIMEGWVIGDGNAYYEKEENALKSVKELGYKTIEEAYDNDEIYFTDWHDEDLDEQGYYYTANGKEVQISSKGSKLGGMERENAEMVLNNNKQISHHTQELASAVKGKSVPAWVVAKVNRSATDLSDATHYLEGTEKAKRGAKTSKGFMVFNYTDDIYASPDTFPTKAKANEFIAQFRKRFEGQGYYRDNRMNKVAPKDIDLLAIPEEFNPFKKN